MILRELTLADEKAFEIMIDQWDGAPGFGMLYGLIAGMHFGSYLKTLHESRDGINLAEGWVPCTQLFAFEGQDIVGKVSIRHQLNEHLKNVGGHIGYGVLPDFRRKGYASLMLKESLSHCRTLGLDRVLVTCDVTNEPSAKVIVKNGGILENVFDPKDGSSKKNRYWIQL